MVSKKWIREQLPKLSVEALIEDLIDSAVDYGYYDDAGMFGAKEEAQKKIEVLRDELLKRFSETA